MCYISHAHPPAHLTSLHWNEEMAAPALTIQEAPEMAAAVIPKKERVPTSVTAPVLLVLFSHR